MNEEEREELDKRVRESIEHSRLLHGMVPNTFHPQVRRALSRCAISVALEHHSGFINLVGSGHFASANAMLRPIFEAAAIAHWLLYAASTERVQAMSVAPLEGAHRDHDTPVLSVLVKELAAAIPSLSALKKLAEILKSPEASWLNKYTHGGIPQLRRKGPDIPPFETWDMFIALIRADFFTLLATAAATVVYDLPELEAYVAMRHKELFYEFVEKAGIDDPYEDWVSLPKQSIVDSWDIPVASE